MQRLTNTGIALVNSLDVNFAPTWYLYWHGLKVTLDFASRVEFLDVNDTGIVSGTFIDDGRAFRLNPYSGTTTILNPLPADPASWGQGINNRGSVLGYSFIPGGVERIGVWRLDNKFQTYFVEGTPEVPTISNQLLWNDTGLIVITRTSSRDLKSYLVPKPGVRLDLSALVEGNALPAWSLIADVNNHGDLVGGGGSSYFNEEQEFLLERIGH